MAKFNSELKIWESTNLPYPHSMDVYFGEIMLEFCDKTPDRVIQFHHEENKALTCSELKNSSIAIAKNLLALGIKSDDIVTMICRNSNFVTSFIHGCVLMGAIINPLTHQLSADNISRLLMQTRPKMIICDPDMLDTVKEAIKFINLLFIYVTGDDSVDGLPNTHELLKMNEFDFVQPKFDKKADEKLLAILCSSGTTKLQKGVCVTHATCLRWDFNKMPPRPPSRPFTFSDAYWSSGFFLHLYIPFYPNDLRIWSREKFSVEKLIEIVETQKITNFNLVPSSLAAMLESEEFLSSNHDSLRSLMVLGSLFTESMRKKFREAFPNRLLMTCYGMTEVFVSLTKPGEAYNGSSSGSIISPNLTIKICDEDGKNLGVNERGEIRVKTQFEFKVINLKI
jgi:crotonobetaine/carnitine-CoA ligase